MSKQYQYVPKVKKQQAQPKEEKQADSQDHFNLSFNAGTVSA
jgi:hypothetical protein